MDACLGCGEAGRHFDWCPIVRVRLGYYRVAGKVKMTTIKAPARHGKAMEPVFTPRIIQEPMEMPVLEPAREREMAPLKSAPAQREQGRYI